MLESLIKDPRLDLQSHGLNSSLLSPIFTSWSVDLLIPQCLQFPPFQNALFLNSHLLGCLVFLTLWLLDTSKSHAVALHWSADRSSPALGLHDNFPPVCLFSSLELKLQERCRRLPIVAHACSSSLKRLSQGDGKLEARQNKNQNFSISCLCFSGMQSFPGV